MKTPILIVSNYRTGSSAYSAKLAEEHNLMWFAEPHLYPKLYYKLLSLMNTTERGFIVKFMSDQIEQYDIYKKLLRSDSYKIKLLRRDTEAQILSHYVATCTGIWNTVNGNRPDSYQVKIDLSLLKSSIDIINESRKILDNLECDFDEVIYYEDLGIVTTSKYHKLEKLHQTSNIDEIRDVLRNHQFSK
jgi:hypothetical protein